MPLTRPLFLASLAGIAALLPTAAAHGQDNQPDRFFSDKISEAEAEGEAPSATVWQGSLTSSTFVYRETGKSINNAAGKVADNASPASRLYTDLRAQVDARYVAGSSWNAHADARTRLSASCTFTLDTASSPDDCRSQSGLYGDNEYDVRELYIRRAGESVDVQLGRQYVVDLAAVKIDGVRLQYQTSEKLGFLGFAGLYPSRGSRSIADDYPTETLAGGMTGDRILPVAGGVGTAYRLRNLYGSFGGVGILPMARQLDGTAEATRIFVTSSGYWRQSSDFDFYHFVIVDLAGESGAGITNLSAGFNYRPSPTLRLNAAVNHVDTETLNVTAQTRLEDPGLNNTALQNNIDVQRIASQSVRVGLSNSFREERFEVSVSGQLRRRPKITLNMAGLPGIDAAKAGEIMLSFVDRRSVAGFRLGASLLGIFGVGGETYARNQSTFVRLFGSHEFKEGLGQYEAEVSYLASKDTGAGVACQPGAALAQCFGASQVGTLSAGGNVFYRFTLDWLAIANLSVARQGFTSQEIGGQTAQPANLLLSGFLRVAYRF